jgi:catechol 2,3-dioxygenase-like lactoylglutathione lyase family enzyme
MLKIGVFGFYHDDVARQRLSPVRTRDFMRTVWEMDPPEHRLGDVPDVPGFVKLTTVSRQPVYVQALSDDMAGAAGLLNCDGYVAIIDAVKILAPKKIQSALRRLYDLHPRADLIIAAGRQNELDALSCDEIRSILGLNAGLPVMPYVLGEDKTVHRLIRRLVRYIENPDRVPPPIFKGERLPALVAAAPESAPVDPPDKKPAAPRIHGLDHVTIVVTDLERSLAFYRGKLGFRLLGHIDFPDDARGRILTHLDTGRGLLELVSFAHDPAQPGGPPGDTRTLIQHFALRVTDLDAVAQPLLAAGIPFTRMPVTTPNGVRVAFFTDPDGTLIELIEGDMVYSRR